MKISATAMRAVLLASASTFILVPQLAHAQDGAVAGPGADEAAPAPEITVVGSRIENAKIAGALPVTVVSENAIAATGSVSGDDLFRSIPQAGDVQFQEIGRAHV